MEDELESAFKRYGKIIDIFVPKEPGNSRSRGFAFVTFEKKRDAEDAVDDMDNRDLDGRQVRVNMARTRPPLPEGAPAPGSGRAPPRSGGGGGGSCRDFARGSCTRGDKCRFSHDGASSSGGSDRRRSRSRSRSRGRH